MLTVKGLSAGYGRARILEDVSLEVLTGEVVAIMGRNGAGKSTTMKAIMGLIPAFGGEVRVDGHRTDGVPSHQIARLGVGYVPEDRRIFTDLTVRENLEVGRRKRREDAPFWTFDSLFRLFPNLGGMLDRPGGSMSGGEQQMLTIARTLMGNPRLLLLDEPSEGLAPVVVEQMAHAILELKRQGLTVLLSEQNLHFSAAVADRAYVLEMGRTRYSGSLAELLDAGEVRNRYLSL
jgi:branched-chain amino acid transport system ATP-binding protein